MTEKWQNIPLIDHKSHHYVYITVADDIEDRIETGELASGEPLPGDMTLARLYGISRDSARRTKQELRERGQVKTVYQIR